VTNQQRELDVKLNKLSEVQLDFFQNVTAMTDQQQQWIGHKCARLENMMETLVAMFVECTANINKNQTNACEIRPQQLGQHEQNQNTENVTLKLEKLISDAKEFNNQTTARLERGLRSLAENLRQQQNDQLQQLTSVNRQQMENLTTTQTDFMTSIQTVINQSANRLLSLESQHEELETALQNISRVQLGHARDVREMYTRSLEELKRAQFKGTQLVLLNESMDSSRRQQVSALVGM